MTKKIERLFQKQKAILKDIESLRQFKEPVLLLIKRDSTVEFYEDAKGTEFEFKHSDGSDRRIKLTSRGLKTFDYASRTFKGYICYEDEPFPLPSDPLFLTEEIEVIFDKLWTANDDLKAMKLREWGSLIWKLLIGIAIVIGALAFLKMLWPEKAVEVATVVSDNLTAMNPTVLG